MSRFVLHEIAGVTVKYKAECNVKEKKRRVQYLMVMMMNIIIDDQVFFSSSIIQIDHAFTFYFTATNPRPYVVGFLRRSFSGPPQRDTRLFPKGGVIKRLADRQQAENPENSWMRAKVVLKELQCACVSRNIFALTIFALTIFKNRLDDFCLEDF